MNNMYANLVVYLVDTSPSLKEKQKYVNDMKELDIQFNYLYVEYLVEKGDTVVLKDYLTQLKSSGEVINYKYIINRSLKFNKPDLAATYLAENYKAEGKSVGMEQAKKDISQIQEKFGEVTRYFKNVTGKNYKAYMVNREETLDADEIKVLSNLNYDNVNIYKERGEYQVIVDLQENSPELVLYSLYGDPGAYGYSLQIVNTPEGYKVQILD